MASYLVATICVGTAWLMLSFSNSACVKCFSGTIWRGIRLKGLSCELQRFKKIQNVSWCSSHVGTSKIPNIMPSLSQSCFISCSNFKDSKHCKNHLSSCFISCSNFKDSKHCKNHLSSCFISCSNFKDSKHTYLRLSQNTARIIISCWNFKDPKNHGQSPRLLQDNASFLLEEIFWCFPPVCSEGLVDGGRNGYQTQRMGNKP